MGGDRFFWYLFGGILLVVGVAFLAATAGVNLFADPTQLDGAPPWVFVLAGLLCSVAGGAIIYYARKTAARDRRLMQSGLQLTATVINLRRSMIEINRRTRWHVVYRYEHSKGRPLEGKSRAMPGEEAWGFKPGDKVAIKIDPQKPGESLFLGPA